MEVIERVVQVWDCLEGVGVWRGEVVEGIERRLASRDLHRAWRRGVVEVREGVERVIAAG